MKRTFGQIAVGLDFNPSGDNAVSIMKQKFADAIDAMHDLRNISESNEQKRYASAAITQAEIAQMVAVKALTWKDHVPDPIDFNAEVVERSKVVPVLVDFYQDGCHWCHVLAPHLLQLANDKNFDLVMIDVRREKELKANFKITQVPRFLIFTDGALSWDSMSEDWAGIMGTVKRIDAVIANIRGFEQEEGDVKGEQFEKDLKS